MEINVNEKTNLELALTYARKGWYVFPVYSIKDGACSCGNADCKSPGKHPRTQHGVNDATNDEQQVNLWWQENPDANIGVRTGKISGISVLDIDQKSGGFESIKAFDLPSTLVSNTGGNGQHHIYKYDEKIPTLVGFRPGIDFRSNGGYIVVPLSNHKSGKEYVWVDLTVEPALAPDWMKTKGLTKTVQPLPGTIREGSRNANLTSLAGSMRRRGASEEAIAVALIEENKKCNPPLDESEVLNIAKSVGRYEPQAEEEVTNSGLLSQDQMNEIKKRIEAIPKDSAPTDLPTLLNPILEVIANINIAQGDALLKSTIKEHFGWKNGEIATYEKVLKGYRKDTLDGEAQGSLGKEDLIKRLHDAKVIKTVHPAQDYIDGTMLFCVKAQDTRCIVTSDDRDIFELNASLSKGFNLEQESVDMARFSSQGLTAFLEGEYDVNISNLYQKIHDYVKRFIIVPQDSYLTYLTLWVIGTYVFRIFRYFPYVWLNAEKGSGKSLLMHILAQIAFNGELTLNPTESVIFRDISTNLITLFIDEVEQLRKRDKDTYGALISILNAGFNKSGSVKRTETIGGVHVVKSYNVYSPKMFAGINEIDDVLQDRTFRIPLLRKKDNESVERYKETNEILRLQQEIRDDLYVFALTKAEAIAELYNTEGVIKGLGHLNNRELDIWEPIFLLANLVDLESSSLNLTSILEDLSKESVDEKQAESVTQNDTYRVLNVLKSMLDDGEITPFSDNGEIKEFDAGEVLSYFKGWEEFNWIEKTHSLTRQLKKVHIMSDQKRFEGGKKRRIYIIKTKEFADWCERFKI
jgi:hypothetical protein